MLFDAIFADLFEKGIDLKEKVVILVGNKIDTNKRPIKKEEIEEFAKKI